MQQNKDIVQLQIGYHILEGKKMALKKPLAIMETVQQDSSIGSASSEAGDGSQTSTCCKVRMRRGHTLQREKRGSAAVWVGQSCQCWVSCTG